MVAPPQRTRRVGGVAVKRNAIARAQYLELDLAEPVSLDDDICGYKVEWPLLRLRVNRQNRASLQNNVSVDCVPGGGGRRRLAPEQTKDEADRPTLSADDQYCPILDMGEAIRRRCKHSIRRLPGQNGLGRAARARRLVAPACSTRARRSAALPRARPTIDRQ